MAESSDSHRDSDFFCPSIVEFLAEDENRRHQSLGAT